MNGEGAGEVLFEFHELGTQIRVAAIDAATGIEVIAIAPRTATRAQMQAVALAKLRRRLEREREQQEQVARPGRYA